MSVREEEVEYIHLLCGAAPPDIVSNPRRVVVLIEQEGTADWQDRISEWIIDSGCLYMMAWGIDCSSWDDSVDYALLSRYENQEIPDDRFVMTTWHEEEPLSEVFFYCLMCAFHPTIELSRATILHIAPSERREDLLAIYNREKAELTMESADLPSHAPLTRWIKRLLQRR